MSKQFSNPELKKLINDLYNENNFTINEDIKKIISKSSHVRYQTLLNHYNEIKNIIIEKLLKSENSSNSSNTNEYIEIKEIEIQTNSIETQTEIQIETQIETYTEIIINPSIVNVIDKKDILEKNFTLNNKLKDYIYKYENLKKEFKIYRNSTNKNDNTTDEEEINYEKEHRKIPYLKLTELSSINIIKELKLLSRHNLKQLYNRYFSNKINRQFSIYN